MWSTIFRLYAALRKFSQDASITLILERNIPRALLYIGAKTHGIGRVFRIVYFTGSEIEKQVFAFWLLSKGYHNTSFSFITRRSKLLCILAWTWCNLNWRVSYSSCINFHTNNRESWLNHFVICLSNDRIIFSIKISLSLSRSNKCTELY